MSLTVRACVYAYISVYGCVHVHAWEQRSVFKWVSRMCACACLGACVLASNSRREYVTILSKCNIQNIFI